MEEPLVEIKEEEEKKQRLTMKEEGEYMNEETAVRGGVCSHGSQACRVGT